MLNLTGFKGLGENVQVLDIFLLKATWMKCNSEVYLDYINLSNPFDSTCSKRIPDVTLIGKSNSL